MTTTTVREVVLIVLHKYMDSRLVEFSSCHTWFDCKFILRMKMGKEVTVKTKQQRQLSRWCYTVSR